jgi:uncharacterized membrane protein
VEDKLVRHTPLEGCVEQVLLNDDAVAGDHYADDYGNDWVVHDDRDGLQLQFHNEVDVWIPIWTAMHIKLPGLRRIERKHPETPAETIVMDATSDVDELSTSLPQVRSVPPSQPFIWISKGWDDLLHHKGGSLAYGALVSVLGALILMYQRHPYFIAAAISGFLLVGPVIAAGLCELSRRRTRGEVSDFGTSLRTLGGHRKSLTHYATLMLGFGVAWFVLSSLMLYAVFGTVGPSLEDTVWGDVLRTLTVAEILAYLVVGGVLACVVFALSVVTVPMIVDRNVDATTAMRTSLRVSLVADLPAMIVWGSLCVILVGIGFATFLVGMVVIFPLLGHATWYAYLDLVE